MPFLTATTSKTIGIFTKPSIPFNFRDKNAIQLTVQTDENNNATVWARPDSGRSIVIDWGDDSEVTKTSVSSDNGHTHNYASSGTYNVKIYGDVQIFGKSSADADNPYYLGVSSFGNISTLTSLAYAFARTGNITTVPASIPSTVTSLQGMFAQNTIFNDANVATWNTSNVTQMSEMFSGATVFNSNISTWDTGNVTNMQSMFSGASAFNQPIGSWNVSNVRFMAYMFQDAVSFNQDLDNWDTSSVFGSYFSNMFSGATAFNGNVSTWDVSAATDMSRMFFGASVFNQDLDNWNTSNFTETTGMFQNAVSFNGNISTWDTSNVWNMRSTFEGASSFNQPIGSWDTSSVTSSSSMSSMFENASSFNQDLTGWDVSALSPPPFEPNDFSTGSALSSYYIPLWGVSEFIVLDNPNPFSTSQNDYFGLAVAIDGNVAIVGANSEDESAGVSSGKAYIYDATDGTLLHTLNNPNANTDNVQDVFGQSVAISGNVAIVGAPGEDDAGGIAGKAYLFDVNTGSLLHTLNNPNTFGTSQLDYFGWSVDIKGNYCIVGAYNEDSTGKTSTGAAYIFAVDTGTLLYTKTNSSGTSYSNFGWSVAVGDFYYAIGAPDKVGSDWLGGAVLYGRLDTGSTIREIRSPNNDNGDRFGYSVAISGSNLIVGAPFVDENSDEGLVYSGKVYRYTLTTSSSFPLSVNTFNNPNPVGTAERDYFGWSVAAAGDHSIAGAYQEDDDISISSSSAGKAYINNSLFIRHTLNNPNRYGTPRFDNFGYSVGITELDSVTNDYRVIVGAWGEGDADGTSSGKAYIYRLNVS